MPQVVGALFDRTPRDADSVRSFYMLARPGFFGGFGSWLDMFSPLLWNYGKLPTLDDYDSVMIGLDWQIVGMDMNAAIGKQSEAIAA